MLVLYYFQSGMFLELYSKEGEGQLKGMLYNVQAHEHNNNILLKLFRIAVGNLVLTWVWAARLCKCVYSIQSLKWGLLCRKTLQVIMIGVFVM